MVKKGIIEVCLGYLATESFTVLFKLLGTIRMLLDKNDEVACRLGINKNFLSKLEQSAVVKEHEGIRCESLRIFASIAKNCCNHEVMKTLEEYNIVRNLVSLLQSEHMKMKNEAILSLVIITSTLGGDVLKSHTNETCDRLKVILASPSPDEFFINCLNFIKTSHQSLAVRTAFKEQGLYEALNKYKTHSNEKIKKLLETINQEMLF